MVTGDPNFDTGDVTRLPDICVTKSFKETACLPVNTLSYKTSFPSSLTAM